MYLLAILSSLICIQLISIVSSDTSDASESLRSNILIQTPTILDNENNEEHDYIPRSTSFLRFGRKLPPPFLRFGRTQPTTFLRFGRSQPTYLRFGKMGQFLRFG